MKRELREQLGLRFDAGMLARARKVATDRKMTVTAVIEHGLELALRQLEALPPLERLSAPPAAPPSLPHVDQAPPTYSERRRRGQRAARNTG